jgi:hypothetical protein
MTLRRHGRERLARMWCNQFFSFKHCGMCGGGGRNPPWNNPKNS